jgi:DNA-binding response OmpR family regulator
VARFAHLLFLGKLDADRRRSLTAIAQASKLELANTETTPAALSWLEQNEPALVAFDTRVARADKVCEKVRSKTALTGVPLIALTSDISDVFVEKLYSMGADDVIPAEQSVALLSRLKRLPLGKPTESTNERGRAVVCDRDKARGAVFGRVLSNAGYDVKLALDDVALKFFAQQKDVRLMVAGAELGVDRELIELARKAGSEAVWVVTAQRKDIADVRELLDGLDRVVVMGAYLPPESVLFSSNEMLSGTDKVERQSPRMLYGTCVWFRGAGSDEDELGLSYNISAGGLFVRTLLPPEDGQVWLELRPPRHKRRVRLAARVAWRRGFDLASTAAAPPGFGVQILDGLGDDRQQFVDGFHTLIDTPRSSAPSISVPKNLPALVALSAPLGVTVRDSTAVEVPAAAQPAAPPSPETPPGPPTTLQPRVVEPVASESTAASAPTAPESPAPPEVGKPPPEVAPMAPPQPASPQEAPMAVAAPAAPDPPDADLAGMPRSAGMKFVWWGAAGGVLLAFGFFAFEWWSSRAEDLRAPPPELNAPAESVAKVPGSVEATESSSPASGISPAPSASAAEVAPEATSDGGDDGDDGSRLNWGQGYLIVESATDADVYATGFKVGRTNAKNQSSCGLKFVRLGQGDPPSWLTPGQTVDVECRAITRVKLEPRP